MTTPVQSPQEAVRSIARLHRILEASKLLASTLDLAELTTIILRLVRDEVGTDRGTVFVLDRRRKLLRSLVAQGIEGTEIMEFACAEGSQTLVNIFGEPPRR